VMQAPDPDHKVEMLTSLKDLSRAARPGREYPDQRRARWLGGLHPRHRHAGDLCPNSEVAVSSCGSRLPGSVQSKDSAYEKYTIQFPVF
jgi:hypothetical protein